MFIKKIITFSAGLCFLMLLSSKIIFPAESDEDSTNSTVTFNNRLLSINAKEVRAEDLMKEIGEKCGIKIVVIGEVFSEVPVNLQLKNKPIRKGIERVLRVANISNYLMHFDDGDNGSRLVELDLIGKKGGEKYLTEGLSNNPKSPASITQKDAAILKKLDNSLKNQTNDQDKAKIQENFLKIMNEVLNSKMGEGEEPDPEEILRLFKEVVPPEMKDQIPPEVLEELEKLE
jgi:hypothetical protein